MAIRGIGEGTLGKRVKVQETWLVQLMYWKEVEALFFHARPLWVGESYTNKKNMYRNQIWFMIWLFKGLDYWTGGNHRETSRGGG